MAPEAPAPPGVPLWQTHPPRTYGESALLGVRGPTQTRAGARGPIDGLASDAGSWEEDPGDGSPELLSGRRSE